MDAVHPGDTPPNPSGRPVVVTNRPVLTNDPMLSVEDVVDTTNEKPSGEAAATPSGVPKISRAAKNIVPVTSKLVETQEPTKLATDNNTSDDHAEPIAKTADSIEKAEAPAEQTTPSREKMKIEPLHEVKSSSDEDESEVKPEDVETPEDNEEESKSAQELEIERHIAAGTYFVPIGQVKKRRRMLIVLVFLTMLALIIVLDLLLDMELLGLELPHTNFIN